MDLKTKLKQDMVEAQKAGNSRLKDALRLLWSEIGYIAVDKEVEDEDVIIMLKKEAKKRKDAVEIYKKAKDKTREEQEEFELKIIEKYLPEQMSEEEVKRIVKEAAKETGKKGGVLIGEVMGRLKGQADGKIVAKIVSANYG